MLLQPRETIDGLPAYELNLDLASIGKGNSHVMSLNTSGINLTYNNNAPRDQSVGITIYADTVSYASVREGDGLTAYITQDELESKYIDYAIYANPVLTLEPSITELEKGTTETIQATLSGQGYIKEGAEYVPVDGATYGTASNVLAEDKRSATIDLTGVEITFDEETHQYVYKDATTTLVNYFGEEFDVTSQYLVFIPPKVTFHTTTLTTPEVVGTWNDGASETSKEVELVAPEMEFEEGTLVEGQVPTITAPTGYVFVGWELAGGTDVTFSMTPTLLQAYANLYPIFEVDTLVDEDEDTDPETPGDGIPDKYQTKVIYKIYNGLFVLMQILKK